MLTIPRPLRSTPSPQPRPRRSPDAPHQSHHTPTPQMLTIPRPLRSTPSPQPRPRRSPDAPHQRHLTPTPLMLAIARLLWRPPSPQPHPRHQTGPRSSRSSTVACNRLLGRLLLTPQLLMLRVGRFGPLMMGLPLRSDVGRSLSALSTPPPDSLSAPALAVVVSDSLSMYALAAVGPHLCRCRFRQLVDLRSLCLCAIPT